MGLKPRWSLHLFLFPFLTLEECLEGCVENLCRGVMLGREVSEGFSCRVLDGRALGLSL